MTVPNADAALRVFMREALRLRWRKYRKGLARCRRRASEDAVHDLRIESRRLLATLDALGGLVPRRMLQAATRAIKKRTKGLGSLRDIQVQRATVHDLSEQLTGLEGLGKRLAREERRRVAATARKLKHHTAHGAADAISSVKRALRRRSRRPVRTAGPPLVPALAAAFEAVEKTFAAIDPAQPHTIHRARKELRRFRYLAEVFEPVAPAITQGYLDHLQELQGEMGRIQDATVLNATVDRYLRKHANGDADPARTRDVLERRRSDLIRAFVNHR